jgi:hypothetical protein
MYSLVLATFAPYDIHSRSTQILPNKSIPWTYPLSVHEWFQVISPNLSHVSHGRVEMPSGMRDAGATVGS